MTPLEMPKSCSLISVARVPVPGDAGLQELGGAVAQVPGVLEEDLLHPGLGLRHQLPLRPGQQHPTQGHRPVF